MLTIPEQYRYDEFEIGVLSGYATPAPGHQKKFDQIILGLRPTKISVACIYSGDISDKLTLLSTAIEKLKDVHIDFCMYPDTIKLNEEQEALLDHIPHQTFYGFKDDVLCGTAALSSCDVGVFLAPGGPTITERLKKGLDYLENKNIPALHLQR